MVMFKIVSKKRYKRLLDKLGEKEEAIVTYGEYVHRYYSIIRELLCRNNVSGDSLVDHDPFSLIENLDNHRYEDGYQQALCENKATIREHEKTIEKQEKEIKELIKENNSLHEYIRNHNNE